MKENPNLLNLTLAGSNDLTKTTIAIATPKTKSA